YTGTQSYSAISALTAEITVGMAQDYARELAKLSHIVPIFVLMKHVWIPIAVSATERRRLRTSEDCDHECWLGGIRRFYAVDGSPSTTSCSRRRILRGSFVATQEVSVLIYGWQRQLHTLATLTAYCGTCRCSGPHGLRKFVTKFSLFFIPLFAVSNEHYLECPVCGVRSTVPPRDIPNLVAQASIQPSPGEMIRTLPRTAEPAWPDLP
ncbi:zinc ribbon domain-containing protein, partial [Nocardia tenerifensis]|uniref:zinc ribbon domain-containing protein n=1 Tax=Nocardia tenerifensis TaxID=228006 RepID=UPI001C3F2440